MYKKPSIYILIEWMKAKAEYTCMIYVKPVPEAIATVTASQPMINAYKNQF